MTAPISFFYFDLGNVLLSFDHRRACRQVAELANHHEHVIWRELFESGLQWRYERGEIDCAALHEELCRRIGREPPIDDMLLAASDIFTSNESIEPIVAGLARAGHSLGILSNTCAAHWRFCSGGRFPMLEHFEHLALSFEIGSAKPEARIYQRAAELAERPPREIFFTDDRPENVAAALQVGFDAVLYEDTPSLLTALRQRGLWAGE